ncbi:MAG: hypothetical protein DWP95_06725, partial [Proteobacteria bacterium]
ISQVQMNNQPYPDFAFHGYWQGHEVTYQSQNIPVPWISHLMINSLLPNFTPAQRTALINQSQGEIKQMRFRYDHEQQQLKQLSAQFHGVGTDLPNLTMAGFAGTYLYHDQVSRLQLDSDGGLLRMPGVFRGTAQWQRLLLQANWYHQEVAQLTVNQLWCDCGDFQLDATANLRLDEVPYFQINSHIDDVDMAKLRDYWPHTVWKPKTIDWLDHGLLAGTVSNARLVAGGEIRTDSFKNGTAVLYAQTQVRDASVQFNPDWPRVHDLNAEVDITADSIAVMIDGASTEAIAIKPSRVDIPDFSAVEVVADIQASGQDNDLLDYLSRSPISGDLNLQKDLQLSGHQDVELALRIPIVDGPQPLIEPQGLIRLSDTQLQWQDLVLSDINGLVKLDGFSLKPQQLTARLAGRDTLVGGTINTRNRSGAQVDIQLQGRYGILDWLAIDMTPPPISGDSNWLIRLQNQSDGVQLKATTDLQGVAVNLPPPLDKAADTAQTLTVVCDIPCDQGPVYIYYDDRVVAELMAEQQQFSISHIYFGADENPPKELISGHIQQLDLDQWLALVKTWQQNGEATEPASLPTTNIVVEELIFMSRTWSQVSLAVNTQDDGLLITVAGEAVKGEILVADDLQRRGITVDFEYLNWPVADVESLTEESVDGGIPDIHLWVEQFSFSDVPLGRLRMELRNVADGIKVEQLSMKSELIELNANGEWLRTSRGLGTSRFNIVIISERIAEFLQQMEFNAPISNAQTLIEMDVHWPGLPAAFDVAALSGYLRIAIGQGEVLDQQPGFGRVLGLFNLTNLPRRLLLDFRDVLAEGLHFEEMTGEFNLINGVAMTDDFLIRASAAKIHMSGTVNFVDRSYDQIIIIRPQIGKTFPTLGAIAGGPVGAAAGFLVQGLLGKQLKSANQIKYHVTGPWSEPEIELLEQQDE